MLHIWPEDPTAEQSKKLRFDLDYHEDIRLKNREVLHIRLIRPEDKQALQSGLAGLSPTSRYLRFFMGKSQFSESELRYLTEIDYDQHFALCGFVSIEGENTGVGVARYFRLQAEPEVAEAAVAVIDAYQQLGIGRALVERLSQAALERGVQWFQCEFLAQNTVIQKLIAELSPLALIHQEDEVCLARVPLHSIHPTAKSDLQVLMTYAADQALDLSHRLFSQLEHGRQVLKEKLVSKSPLE